MSWNNTVRCGHCYETGHNKRTCPKYTERIADRAKAELSSGEGKDGYFGKQYAKRTGTWIDGSCAKELQKNAPGRKRRCKYCNKTGHNTRTCQELKTAKATTLADTKVVRAKVAKALASAGLGIGALVVREDRYGSKTGYMVTGFNMTDLTNESVNHNPNVVQLKVLNTTNVDRWNLTTAIPLPPIEGVNENSWNQNTQLVGPVSGSAVTEALPEGWIEDESFLTEMFNGRQSPDWYENRWEG